MVPRAGSVKMYRIVKPRALRPPTIAQHRLALHGHSSTDERFVAFEGVSELIFHFASANLENWVKAEMWKASEDVMVIEDDVTLQRRIFCRRSSSASIHEVTF